MQRLLLKKQLLSLALMALVLSSPMAHAYSCKDIDDRIAAAQKAASAEFAKANALQAAVDAAPSLWDSIVDTFNIWSPVPTSIADVVEGSATDAALSACGNVAQHVAGGLDMTNKLIQQGDVLIASQGAGVSQANARFARIRGHKHMKEARRLLAWKQKHCQCTEVAGGNAQIEGDDDTEGNLLEWLERTSHLQDGDERRKGDRRQRDAHQSERRGR